MKTSPSRLRSDKAPARAGPVPDALCCSRRNFLGQMSCAASVAFAWAAAGTGARRVFAKEPEGAKRIDTQSWAYVDRLGDGLYTTISTPFQPGRARPDPTTFSNGGIIAGKNRVFLIEGFNQPKGAAWQAAVTKKAVGRAPTHVALTHFHGDHSGGLPGYQSGADAPAILATKETRRLLLEKLHKQVPPPPTDGGRFARTRKLLLPDTILIDETRPVMLDLGGRKVRLVPRKGHTTSDLTIELDEPRIIWCGDLFFHGLFPYYGDAIPSELNKTIQTLVKEDFAVYVPGHGPRTDAKGLATYLEMLQVVEHAARHAFNKGVPASKAWQTFSIPKELGEWRKFRPDVHRFAFEAWERELKAK